MDYHWQAILEDGSVIDQFKEGQDQTFKPVMENKDKLVELKLISTDGQNRQYSVNMQTGEFNLNGFKIQSSIRIAECDKKEPIYWRRNQVILLGVVGEPIPVGYIIGWQVNTEGKNYQQQFMIQPDGGIILLHKI